MNSKERLVLPALACLHLAACASTVPNRNPVGQNFPSVMGSDLEDTVRRIPEEFAKGHAVVLIGYKQRSQFDIDRWLIGLTQLGLEVPVVELPTIPGMVPGLFSGRIDNGMRSGIPHEDWTTVVTLYGEDARKVLELTGSEHPNNARVLLLEPGGSVSWFHDRGFSPRFLVELRDKLQACDGHTIDRTQDRSPQAMRLP